MFDVVSKHASAIRLAEPKMSQVASVKREPALQTKAWETLCAHENCNSSNFLGVSTAEPQPSWLGKVPASVSARKPCSALSGVGPDRRL